MKTFNEPYPIIGADISENGRALQAIIEKFPAAGMPWPLPDCTVPI